MLKRGLATLVFLSALFGVTSKAEGDPIHDIAICKDYINSAGTGVRIQTTDGQDILEPVPELQQDSYKIKFRVDNNGDFNEEVVAIGQIFKDIGIPGDLGVLVDSWPHDATIINSGNYKYKSHTIDFSVYPVGDYAVRLIADYSVSDDIEDATPLDNTAHRHFTIIPEPSTLGLLGLGMGLAATRRRRQHN